MTKKLTKFDLTGEVGERKLQQKKTSQQKSYYRKNTYCKKRNSQKFLKCGNIFWAFLEEQKNQKKLHEPNPGGRPRLKWLVGERQT